LEVNTHLAEFYGGSISLPANALTVVGEVESAGCADLGVATADTVYR
jgi:hypothetical protein